MHAVIDLSDTSRKSHNAWIEKAAVFIYSLIIGDKRIRTNLVKGETLQIRYFMVCWICW